MAPGAAERESSANPLHKHRLISQGGRRGSGHSLFCRSINSPGGAGLAPAPPQTLPGRGSTGQAHSPPNGQGSSCPKPGVADLVCHSRQRVPKQTPAQACCGRRQEGGQSTTELSSVSSQPAAFPRNGSASRGRILWGWRPSSRSATPPESAPHCPNERRAMSTSLLPSQDKARSRNTGVSCPPGWEQPPGQTLLN